MFPTFVPTVIRRHEREKFGFGCCACRSEGSIKPVKDTAPESQYSTFRAPAEVFTSSVGSRNRFCSPPANEHNYSTIVVCKQPSERHIWRSTLSTRKSASGSGSRTRFASPIPAVDGLLYFPEATGPKKASRPSTSASAVDSLMKVSGPITRPCSSTAMRDIWKLPFAPTASTVAPTPSAVFRLSDRAASRDSFSNFTNVSAGTASEVVLVARDRDAMASSACRPICYGRSSTLARSSFNSRIQREEAMAVSRHSQL
jgi:hypothetical protein